MNKTKQRELIRRIETGRKDLERVSQELKDYFVGLDDIIDRIIKNITAWYCLPEILTRHTTVCLWGLTGNGKTDLVRRLVSGLKKQDSFVELQLSTKGATNLVSYSSTLQGFLSSSNISAEEPGILLLDEIQRFRTVDGDGKDIPDYSFQDLWMLLSDGCFGNESNNKEGLLEVLFSEAYNRDYQEAHAGTNTTKKSKKEEEAAREINEKRKFKQSYWSARQMKRQLHLPESVEEIMKWDGKRKFEIIMEKLDDQTAFVPPVYSKLLIFICGNLDEAYKMSGATEVVDIDADLFHKHSLKINLLTIKAALRSRFKPEQIARFGNNHIIYPSLTKDNYREIIHRNIDRILTTVVDKSAVKFSVHPSFFDAIYRNSVFPAQGTRPVFSTISTFLESNLPVFALKCLEQGVQAVELYYEEKHICADIGSEVFRLKNEGDIDRIKAERRVDENHVFKISAHEAGHCTLYSVLFGVVPTQISVNLADNDTAGFVGIHDIEGNKQQSLDLMVVYLGGRVAEEIFFGEDEVSAGAHSDLAKTTASAAVMIRLQGMNGHASLIENHVGANALHRNLNIDPTNDQIEELVQKQKAKAKEILNAHLPLLQELASVLATDETITPHHYKLLLAKHGVEVEIKDAKDTIHPKYKQIHKGRLMAAASNGHEVTQ